MNRILSLLILLFVFEKSTAQDTIRSQDLPFAGSIYLLSNGIAFPGLNAVTTGANHDWDFSDLTASSQYYDTMYTPSSTNPLFSFYFIDNSLNLNRSNLASKEENVNLGFAGLDDIFNYYYNSAAEFRQPGFGAVVNSIAIPVDYVPNDVLYKFPLYYETEDSTSYEYHIDLTSTIGIYYHVSRTRHNFADGWGTLTTPFGTFDVVRIRSRIVEVDSTYIVQLNSGVKTPPITTYEYKWLGKNFGLPLLQINTTSNNMVTQIQYQDSARNVGVNELLSVVDDPTVFPNPADELIFVKYHLKHRSKVSITIVSVDGKEINISAEEFQDAGINIRSFDLSEQKLSSGNYFVKITAGNSSVGCPLLIRRN